MEYKNLGNSGLRVSVVGLGCNNFGRRCDQAATTSVVDKALDSGVTLFDTADVYGPRGLSEEFLGVALKGKRREAIIATKFMGPMGEGTLWSGAWSGTRSLAPAAAGASAGIEIAWSAGRSLPPEVRGSGIASRSRVCRPRRFPTR